MIGSAEVEMESPYGPRLLVTGHFEDWEQEALDLPAGYSVSWSDGVATNRRWFDEDGYEHMVFSYPLVRS